MVTQWQLPEWSYADLDHFGDTETLNAGIFALLDFCQLDNLNLSRQASSLPARMGASHEQAMAGFKSQQV